MAWLFQLKFQIYIFAVMILQMKQKGKFWKLKTLYFQVYNYKKCWTYSNSESSGICHFSGWKKYAKYSEILFQIQQKQQNKKQKNKHKTKKSGNKYS